MSASAEPPGISSAVPAIPLREDAALPPDGLTARDVRGAITLTAQFTWPHGPTPTPSPDGDPEVLGKIATAARRELRIDLAPIGRMRLRLTSPAFSVPQGVELRARVDRLGHLLVWPDEQTYRVLQPGSLRALFTEGRADVTPLTPTRPVPLSQGRVLGRETQRVEASTPIGKLILEQIPWPGAAESGVALCRALAELVGAATPACAADTIPLRAELVWRESQHRLVFEATAVTTDAQPTTAGFAVPPDAPHFKGDLMPRAPSPLLVSPEMLRAMRRRDGVSDGTAATVAVNASETTRYLLLDGVPIACLLPHSEHTIPGLRPGTYNVGWIDFLGTELTAPQTTTLPNRLIIGEVPEPQP